MNKITLQNKLNEKCTIYTGSECSFCLDGEYIPKGEIVNVEQGGEYQIFFVNYEGTTHQIPLYSIFYFFQDGEKIPNLFLGNHQ